MMNTVIFDFDDTLHDDTAAYHEAALRVSQFVADRYLIDVAELADAYIRAADDFWLHLTPRELGNREQGVRARLWGRALAEFGIRNRELCGFLSYAYDEFRGRRLALFPGVPEMLTNLRRRGVKLGLMTNGFSQTHRSKIKQLGLIDAFDGVFLADEVGMVKPDPNFFLHALDRLQADVATSAMVGDRYERDIIGAKQAGLFTVWVDVGRDHLPRNAQPPDATVHSAIEAPRVLQLA